MKLKKDAHLPTFLQQVRLCAGEVWFVTPQGDKLNLKSVLSEYLFLSAAISTTLVEEGAVELEEHSDALLLTAFFRET